MDKKFCIFDMDGTLVDSMGYWRNLEYDYLTSRGVQLGDKTAELIRRLQPMTLVDAGKVFIEELGFKGTPQTIADEMNAVMEGHYRTCVPIKAGVKAYLEALKSRGARLCTASATNAPLVRTCLTRLEIVGYFDFMLSCQDVGASKDRPDVYFEAARRLGSRPEETAVFEDSLSAMTTAKSAGFYAVAVYDEHSHDNWGKMQEISDEFIADWAEATKRL